MHVAIGFISIASALLAMRKMCGSAMDAPFGNLTKHTFAAIRVRVLMYVDIMIS